MFCKIKKVLFLLGVFLCLSIVCNAGAGFESLFKSGEQAFGEKKYEQAADLFAQALKLAPSDLRSRFRYGQSLFLTQRFAESQAQFQMILQNSPGNITARVFYAESLINMGMTDEARPHIDWILKVQPEHERARFIHAKLTSISEPEETEESEYEPESLPVNIKPLPVVKNQKTSPVKSQEKSFVKTQETQSLKSQQTPSLKKMASTVEKKSEIPVKKEPDEPRKITPTPDGFIHIPAIPASILPVEYQAEDEEDFFKNYPASSIKNQIHPQDAIAAAYNHEKNNYPKKAEPQNIASVSFESLAEGQKDSFVFNLELAKYYVESANLKDAEKCLAVAEKIATEKRNSRGVLETGIFRSLLYVYNLDFNGFGHHLMSLKSSMTPESYQPFLDIYNQGIEVKDEVEKARIAAGVAIGATHFAVAANLLKPAFLRYPDDPIIGRLLSDAQMQSRDYKGAEITLSQIARAYPNNSEAYFNLARFYLTVDYKPNLVRDYAQYAYKVDPTDSRCGIVLGLLDYSQGNVIDGISRIKALLPSLTDPMLKAVCERIILDGENNADANFSSLLALPGSSKGTPETYRILGEDYLKQGSFFSAAKCFEKINDLSEIGRTFLAVASVMSAADEPVNAATLNSLGLSLLTKVLEKDPNNARANLYISLYHYERGNMELAREAVANGLKNKSDKYTENRLNSVYNILNS